MKFLLFEACLLVSAFALFAAPTTTSKTVVILMGPPGSGKGTQAKRIQQELSLPHISTGDILRENIRNETELGCQVKEYVDQGKYAPDELIIDVLLDRVSEDDAAKGYLLDGFPRNLAQAEALEQKLDPKDRLIVIYLDVSDDAVIKRISGRLSCPECGAVYNKYFQPPASENVCDRCGHGLAQRADDTESVVSERLKVYHQQTQPLVEFYKKKGVLVSIDGEQNPEKITEAVRRSLK